MKYEIFQFEYSISSAEFNARLFSATADWLVVIPRSACLPENFEDVFEKQVQQCPDAAAFNLRCLPVQTLYYADPVTLSTSLLWSDAFIVSRKHFKALGGFDKAFYFHSAKTEFSFRLLAAESGKIYYAPNIYINSCIPFSEAGFDQTREIISKLIFSRKYETPQIYKQKKTLAANRLKKENPTALDLLKSELKLSRLDAKLLAAWQQDNQTLVEKVLQQSKSFNAFSRGTWHAPQDVTLGTNSARFSLIIVPTDDATALRRTFDSLNNQTYRRFEIIVPECGASLAENILHEEYAELPVRYKALDENCNFAEAMNAGVSMAMSKYLCFAENGDCFYPEYFEQLAIFAQRNPDKNMFTSSYFSADEMHNGSLRPNVSFAIDAFKIVHQGPPPLISLCCKKALFLRSGSFNKSLPCAATWALWISLIAKDKYSCTQPDIPLTLSLAAKNSTSQGSQLPASEQDVLFNLQEPFFEVGIGEMRKFYDDMLQNISSLKSKGQLDSFLEQESQRTEIN